MGDGLGVLNGVRIHELVGGGVECDAGGSEKAVEDSVVLYIFVDGAELHFRGNTAPRCQIDCFVLGEQLPLFYQQVADPRPNVKCEQSGVPKNPRLGRSGGYSLAERW